MRITDGVGTAYSSNFNCIKMGWSQYKKIHSIYTQMYSWKCNELNLYLCDWLCLSHKKYNTCTQYVSVLVVYQRRGPQDTFTFLGKVLMSRSFLLKLVTVVSLVANAIIKTLKYNILYLTDYELFVTLKLTVMLCLENNMIKKVIYFEFLN